MKDMAAADTELSAALRRFGETPEEWLTRLDRDWQALSARSKPISAKEAAAVWEPFLRDGTITKLQYERLVAAKRYTPVPEIEAAIAETAGDPRMQRLFRALEVKNNELWNDLASVFYGQADRSNLQRILNHPLLYWPLSYQIKATKWLANIMFDKAFGVDSGSMGAWTIAELHNRHMEKMSTDEEYAQYFSDNQTLLFMAQMILPITPFDIGVSMSPWARLILEGMRDKEDPDYKDPYSRNIFSVGPGYTYFNLLPRFLAEQSKPGAAMSGIFGEGAPLSDAQRYLPATIAIKPPSKRSQLQAADAGVYGTIGGTGVTPDFDRSQLPQSDQARFGP
jgi:hypothetical protein